MPKRWTFMIVSLTMIFILTGCALRFPLYTISGYVKDALGSPVEGVELSVSYPQGYQRVFTDKNGYWSVSGIFGKTVITPQATSWTFKPTLKVLDVTSDVKVDFIGQPYQYFVSGHVYDEYGQPISGVTITFEGSNLNATPVKSDLSGFWKSGLLHGKVKVCAEKNGWFFLPSNGRIVSGLSTDVNFIAKKGIGETMYIPIKGTPSALAVDEKDGKLFVTVSSTDLVFVYNVYGYNKIGTFKVGKSPSGICYDSKDGYLFVANSATDTISILNASTGKVVRDLFIGGSPQGVAINVETGTVYVSNSYYNAVDVISASPLGLEASVRVGNSPLGIAVNPQTDMIYVVNSKDDTLSVIDGKDNTLMDEIKVGSNPVGVAVDEGMNRIYVVNRSSGTLSIVNGNDDVVSKTLKIGGSPSGVWVNEENHMVYVTDSSQNTVVVVNGRSGSIVQTVTVGKGPTWISGDESISTVYVTNSIEKTVSVLH